MKSSNRIILGLLALLCLLILPACSTLEQDIDKAIPDGKAQFMQATITGKWSSTQFTAENFVKTPELVTADTLHFRHSDAYVPLIEVEYKGYVRVRNPPPSIPDSR